MLQVDGEIPKCRKPGNKCDIPDLSGDGRRIQALFELIARLKGVVEAGDVLRIAGADVDDLALLAVYADTLRAFKERRDGNEGV
jgi:hypothetical protein